jgi:hypothetical protein
MLGRGRLACERLSAGYTLEVLSLRIVLLPLACRQLLVSVRAICEVRTAVFMDAINVFFWFAMDHQPWLLPSAGTKK